MFSVELPGFDGCASVSFLANPSASMGRKRIACTAGRRDWLRWRGTAARCNGRKTL